MGGTFDPVHFGHLECAQRAQEALGLDRVVFVPTGNPHFKQGTTAASGTDRLAMATLATLANPRFMASPMEVRRPGVTYTIDTVEELRRSLPVDAELFFIIGSDALLTLPRWRRSEELGRLVRFAVLMRPGDDRARVDELAASGVYSIDVIDCPLLDISSSYLRETVAQGRSVRYLTPDAVALYIESHGLYRAGVEAAAQGDSLDSGTAGAKADAAATALAQAGPFSKEFADELRSELADRVSPKRLAHIEGVAATARRLARIYGTDEDAAALAGLLHDWDKGYDDEAMRRRVEEVGLASVLDPFVVQSMPQVLHGPTAAFALKERFPRLPEDVIRAVYYHTTGVAEATDLDKILYIADAIEPGRTFDKADWLREGIGELSLDELYFRVYQFWTCALVEQGRVLHPDTMAIWNALAAQRPKQKHGKGGKSGKKKKSGPKAAR